MKVKNIKVVEIPFESKDDNFQKCLKYIKLMDVDCKKYMPKKSKHELSFELTEASSELANCIRRFLMEEMPVYSMDVNEDNIKTDDSFVLSDFLKKNIELIPFLQTIPDKDIATLNISLNVENKTDDTITIYSGDLQIFDDEKQKKGLDVSKYFSTSIPIIKLRPTASLSITDIKIVSGTGKQDSGKFLLLSNISYKILDVNPVVTTKYNQTGTSSLNSTPQHFKIGYKTHRNIDAKDVIKKCCDQIINRFNAIQQELSNINNDTKVHFSDLIDLETKGDVKILHFKGEYWTIAKIISKYCYLANTNIPFVCSSIIHPSIEESLVKIKHSESISIINAALKSIITDITSIKKAF